MELTTLGWICVQSFICGFIAPMIVTNGPLLKISRKKIHWLSTNNPRSILRHAEKRNKPTKQIMGTYKLLYKSKTMLLLWFKDFVITHVSCPSLPRRRVTTKREGCDRMRGRRQGSVPGPPKETPWKLSMEVAKCTQNTTSISSTHTLVISHLIAMGWWNQHHKCIFQGFPMVCSMPQLD